MLFLSPPRECRAFSLYTHSHTHTHTPHHGRVRATGAKAARAHALTARGTRFQFSMQGSAFFSLSPSLITHHPASAVRPATPPLSPSTFLPARPSHPTSLRAVACTPRPMPTKRRHTHMSSSSSVQGAQVRWAM